MGWGQAARLGEADPYQGPSHQRHGARGPPLRLYLDTSALLKLYVEEEGSSLVHERWTQATAAATSLVTLVEARAALARRRRHGDIAPAHYRLALEQFTDDWERLVRIEVSARLVSRAADLAEAHSLRGYDAIHLASGMVAAQRFAEETVFASWDDALDAAAAREGLTVLRTRRRR